MPSDDNHQSLEAPQVMLLIGDGHFFIPGNVPLDHNNMVRNDQCLRSISDDSLEEVNRTYAVRHQDKHSQVSD